MSITFGLLFAIWGLIAIAWYLCFAVAVVGGQKQWCARLTSIATEPRIIGAMVAVMWLVVFLVPSYEVRYFPKPYWLTELALFGVLYWLNSGKGGFRAILNLICVGCLIAAMFLVR